MIISHGGGLKALYWVEETICGNKGLSARYLLPNDVPVVLHERAKLPVSPGLGVGGRRYQ